MVMVAWCCVASSSLLLLSFFLLKIFYSIRPPSLILFV